jgi:NADH:ubiquinone oxidoreductase subunit 6 (subunit J)
MSQSQLYTGALAMLLTALAMWLLLPRGNQPGRVLGAVLGIASLTLFAGLGAKIGGAGIEWIYGTLAVVAIISAVCTVTFRSPVYCALWFALSLLCTAGIFMVQGAQFLAVATIVVYAGAILVTFLFVLMLAQPGGGAYYDRVSWEGMLAATTGAVVVGVLTMTVVRVFNPPRDPYVLAALDNFRLIEPAASFAPDQVRRASLRRDTTNDVGRWILEIDLDDRAPQVSNRDQARLKTRLAERVPELVNANASADEVELIVGTHVSVIPRASDDRANGVHAREHVATLGGQLFSRHLIAIEVAGTLLLVALVGAVAIVAHDRTKHKQQAARPEPARQVK